MKIILLKHLKFQALERGISTELIKSVLSNPEQILPDREGLMIAQRRYIDNNKNYLLRVIFREEQEIRTGITVYRTSKIGKYWVEDAAEARR